MVVATNLQGYGVQSPLGGTSRMNAESLDSNAKKKKQKKHSFVYKLGVLKHEQSRYGCPWHVVESPSDARIVKDELLPCTIIQSTHELERSIKKKIIVQWRIT